MTGCVPALLALVLAFLDTALTIGTFLRHVHPLLCSNTQYRNS